ncbi:MAG: glycosyl transferase [Deltaproteobacteria bacterium]|nr:MAG: glycosyl transferase [Deltaproteobacteria bacterium]
MKTTVAKRDPTVTVIIPTRNRAKLVKKAVTSVLNQTFEDLEVVVVDDASDDNTRQVVKSFDDSRVNYIFLKRRSGPAGARNTGIKAARGRYIAFIDDDDEWMAEKLKKQIMKFEMCDRGVGLIYCGYYNMYKDLIVEKKAPQFRGEVFQTALRSCPIGSPTPLIRKECFIAVGMFDENLPACEDWDLWIRISRCYQFDFVPEFLAIRYVHGVQLSTDLKRTIAARENILKKYYHELKKHREILSWHYRRLGSLNCIAGNYRDGLKYFVDSIVTYPLNGGAYIHLLLFLLSRSLHRRLAYRYGTRKVGDVTIIS